MTRVVLWALTALAAPFLCVGFAIAYWADVIQSERDVKEIMARYGASK